MYDTGNAELSRRTFDEINSKEILNFLNKTLDFQVFCL